MVAAQLGFVLFAALLVFGFVTSAKEGELRRRCAAACILHPDYVGASRLAPDFSLKDMSGQEVTLRSFRNKVVVLNFWTKTCKPCLEEMPEFSTLQALLRERKDTALLTVSADEGPDDVRDVLKIALRGNVTFPVLFDPNRQVITGQYGTKLFPETWIIDKRGVIRARFDGTRPWSNPVMIELIDAIRSGSYCPVEIHNAHASGEAAKLCEALSEGVPSP